MFSSFFHHLFSYPYRYLIALFFLSLISFTFSFFYLKFDSNQDNLVSKKREYHQNYLEFLNSTADLEYLFIVIELKQKDPSITLKNSDFKEVYQKVFDFLKQHPELYGEVFDQIQTQKTLQQWALLLLDEDNFALFFEILKTNPKLGQNFWQINDLSSLIDFFNLIFTPSFLSQLNQKEFFNESESNPLFEFFESLLTQLDQPKKLSKIDWPIIDGLDWGLASSTLYVIEVLPTKDYQSSQVVAKPLNQLRFFLQQLQKEYPDFNFGVTGRPALQADEMAATEQDSLWIGIAAFLGILLLFRLFYQNLKLIILHFILIGLAICLSLGWVALTIGHLNLLSLVFAVVMIGLGVDYAIYLVFGYLRQEKTEPKVALALAYQKMLWPMFLSLVSTVFAFLTGLMTSFLGLQELGFIAASGLLFCFIVLILGLPGLIYFLKIAPLGFRLASQNYLSFLLPFKKYPKTLWLLIFVLSTLSLWGAGKVFWQFNLLELQDPKAEAVVFEKKLVDQPEYSSWFAVLRADSIEKLKELQQKVDALNSVKNSFSVLNIIQPNQKDRLEKLANLGFPQKIIPFNEAPFDSQKMLTSLKKLRANLDLLLESAFRAGRVEEVKQIDQLSEKLASYENKLNQSNEAALLFLQSQKQVLPKINDLQQTLLAWFSPEVLTIEDLPHFLKKRLVTQKREYTLWAYPANDIWNEAEMRSFIKDLTFLDARVTGAPVHFYYSALDLKESFRWVVLATLVFVLILLSFSFRKISFACWALLPLAIGSLWLLGLMGFLGISLNLANFFAIPILLGLALDHGIHIINHLKKTASFEGLFRAILPAMVLSSLTTLLSFGLLGFVRHAGLASFGQVMAVGSLCYMLAALVLALVLPKNLIKSNT